MKTLLTLFLVLTVTLPVFAKTLHANSGNAAQLPELLAGLNSGDTLILRRGEYKFRSGLMLSNVSDVVIQGEGRVEIVVQNLDDAVLSVRNCERVQIKNLRMKHEKPSAEYICEGPVLDLEYSNKVFIAENWLNGCGAYGVMAERCKEVVIYKNRIFHNTFSALRFEEVTGIVHKNRLYDNMAEILTYGDCDLTFTDNEVHDNGGNSFKHTEFFSEMTGEKYQRRTLKL